MSEVNVLVNLVMILVAAAVGGAVMLRLKQPVILGYLIAGLIVGPFTPGPRADFDQMRFLTEVGLALLLFVTGASMPTSHFRGLGKLILGGGIISIALTIGMGVLLAPLFGLNLAQGFLLGTILAQSSSAVIARILDDRRETQSLHGRIAIGVSIVQDLSSFPLMLFILVFLEQGESTLIEFFIAVGKVLAMAVGTYVLGRFLWPRSLEWFGRLGSEELTLIAALGLALGGGLILQTIGLSFVLGAFLAGLVIAESPLRPSTMSRVAPMRDVFSAVFFVSIGALFDPSVLWELPLPSVGLLSALVIGKAIVAAVAIRIFAPAQVAILSGLLLAQIGEFAFILANIGLNHNAISQTFFSVVIVSAVISIALNSLLLRSAPPVLASIASIIHLDSIINQGSDRVSSAFKRLILLRRKRQQQG